MPDCTAADLLGHGCWTSADCMDWRACASPCSSQAVEPDLNVHLHLTCPVTAPQRLTSWPKGTKSAPSSFGLSTRRCALGKPMQAKLDEALSGRCRKGAAQMVDQMGRLWPDKHHSPDFSLTAMHVCGQEASAQVPAAPLLLPALLSACL